MYLKDSFLLPANSWRYFGILFPCVWILFSCVSMDSEKEALKEKELDTRVELAANQLAQGKPSKSIQTLRTALNKNPKNHKILTIYGLAHLSLGNSSAAIRFLTRAFKVKPSGSGALNLSSAHIQDQNFRESIRNLNLALNKFPKYIFKERIYQNFGATYMGMGQFIKAIESFEKALEINPSYYPAVVELAKLYARVQEHKKSEAMWSLAHGQCPQCFQPVKELVELHLRRDQKQLAMKLLNNYVKQDDIQLNDRLRAKKLQFKLTGINSPKTKKG